jgi:putative DNA primase/helicase
MLTLQQIARALGGEVVDGRYLSVPGPQHSPNDRSLSIMLSDTAPDGFLVNSWSGDNFRACRDHVRAALAGQQMPAANTVQSCKSCREIWKPIWLRAKNPLQHIPRGKRRPEQKSLVEQYLNSRGLELTPSIADEVIRFDPACQFGDETHPAMICLIRDIFTNAGIGIQRTALTPDGNKVERNGKTLRLSLGAIAGGAIKLDDDADVTMGLVVGEGVETCLTARQRYDLAPVWSAVTSGGVASFPVLPGLEGLTLLRENTQMVRAPRRSRHAPCAGTKLGAMYGSATQSPNFATSTTSCARYANERAGLRAWTA